jgi:hypothetical protein
MSTCQDGNMPYSGAIPKIYIYLYHSYISMQTTIGVPFVYKRIQYIKQQAGHFLKQSTIILYLFLVGNI